MDVTLQQLLDTLFQHIPDRQTWMPYAGMAGATLFGLVLMIRGARLAPVLAAGVCMVLGGVGGSFAANGFSLPAWPMIGAVGVAGFILGLVLFRFWLAALVGVCFAGAGLGVYSTQVLAQPIAEYSSHNLNIDGDVTLPEAGAALAQTQSPPEELGKLWTHLSSNKADGTPVVRYFQASIVAIAIATLLAGFTFGMLLPTASRALFAATGGTFLFLCGATAALAKWQPDALNWLQANNTLSWSAVGVTWFGSLLYNIVTCARKRPGKVIDESAPASASAA